MPDEKINWREKVKSPSKINEKMIGGSSDFKSERILKKDQINKVKPQNFNNKAYQEQLRQSLRNKNLNAIKPYENHLSKTEQIAPDKSKLIKHLKQFGDKIDDIAPYFKKVAKLLVKTGPLAAITLFDIESTADDTTELQLMKEWEESQKNQLSDALKPNLNDNTLENVITEKEETSFIDSLKTEDISFNIEEINNSIKMDSSFLIDSIPESDIKKLKEKLVNQEIFEPELLIKNELEPNHYDGMEEPSFDGDSSDGADGGADGGGDGE